MDKQKEIINLTPHELTIYRAADDPEPIKIKPSGTVARCREEEKFLFTVGEIPVTKSEYSVVIDMPGQKYGVIYVVSAIVANAIAARGGRPDVFIPGKGIRDAGGKIVGCLGLKRV